MKYSIKIKASAKKSLARISKQYQLKIVEKIDSLAVNPHQGSQLKGSMTGLRRVRVGNYRVIFEVKNKELVILVIRIGHRKDIYNA